MTKRQRVYSPEKLWKLFQWHDYMKYQIFLENASHPDKKQANKIYRKMQDFESVSLWRFLRYRFLFWKSRISNKFGGSYV